MAEAIGGPTEIVTVPGYFRNELRGHTRPELTAIGSTQAPVSTARRAPPLL
ncbi:hypothetical protein D3C72_2018460 [compost metagenome]